VSFGPNYGYFITSERWFLCWGTDLFQGTGVSIFSDGQRYLGFAIGSDNFVKSFILNLVQIAKSQPHAAFLHIFMALRASRPFCVTPISPSISHLFTDLDTLINTRLLPLLTEKPPTNFQWKMFCGFYVNASTCDVIVVALLSSKKKGLKLNELVIRSAT